MSVELTIASFLRLARDDLEAARLLSVAGNRNDLYHAEQAAEKIIRAVLTSESIQGERHHQIDRMLAQIPAENPLKVLLTPLEPLKDFETTYRYPTPGGGRIKRPVSQQQFTKFATDIETALNAAAARFKVDLGSPDTPAGNR